MDPRTAVVGVRRVVQSQLATEALQSYDRTDYQAKRPRTYVFKMNSHCSKMFTRPKFSPLPPVNGEALARDSINSLPELIRHNAIHNGDRLFCVQGQGIGETSLTISFKELEDAISACSFWVKGQLHSSQAELETAGRRPIALYLESDIGLFIYIAAMLASSIPVSVSMKIYGLRC